MKYYIEIGGKVDDEHLLERMKSWTGWDYVDVVITVHIPNNKKGMSANGTEKTIKKALKWLLEEVLEEVKELPSEKRV